MDIDRIAIEPFLLAFMGGSIHQGVRYLYSSHQLGYGVYSLLRLLIFITLAGIAIYLKRDSEQITSESALMLTLLFLGVWA